MLCNSMVLVMEGERSALQALPTELLVYILDFLPPPVIKLPCDASHRGCKYYRGSITIERVLWYSWGALCK